MFGAYTRFEGDARFPSVGVNIGVLEPGQPSCYYHGEDEQEDFLVLAGECLLLVEGQERPLRPGTSSTARPGPSTCSSAPATGPCAVLAAGTRPAATPSTRYPSWPNATAPASRARRATPTRPCRGDARPTAREPDRARPDPPDHGDGTRAARRDRAGRPQLCCGRAPRPAEPLDLATGRRHGLINNAGLAGQRGHTASGFELAFGTNHVGTSC